MDSDFVKGIGGIALLCVVFSIGCMTGYNAYEPRVVTTEGPVVWRTKEVEKRVEVIVDRPVEVLAYKDVPGPERIVEVEKVVFKDRYTIIPAKDREKIVYRDRFVEVEKPVYYWMAECAPSRKRLR